MAGILVSNRVLLKNKVCAFGRRLVSTSNKNNDTAAAAVSESGCKTEVKNWISYGFDYSSKEGDRSALRSIMFSAVTLCLTVGGFYWAYAPDYNLRDWSQREAFLELRRREQAGLPLIDPNFINPAQIPLPTDEELENVEIII